MKFLKLHKIKTNEVFIINAEEILWIYTCRDNNKIYSGIDVICEDADTTYVNETPEKIYSMIESLK